MKTIYGVVDDDGLTFWFESKKEAERFLDQNWKSATEYYKIIENNVWEDGELTAEQAQGEDGGA